MNADQNLLCWWWGRQWSWRSSDKYDWFLCRRAFSFLNDDRLIGFDVGDRFFLTSGPTDLER